MRWRKLGHIFCADHHADWMATHAMIPIADPLDGDRYRIYFSPRDGKNRGHGAYLELDMRRPTDVVRLHTQPILTPGALGCFDDSGALPNSIVHYQGRTLLYYTGINLGVTVKIRNAIGLAEWNADAHRFERCFPGPVIDRTRLQPHFVATPDVQHDGTQFHAWFTACQRWEAGEPEAKHYYNLEYASSLDGVTWQRTGETAIDFHDAHEYALGVPRVMQEDGQWHMWFCARGSADRPTYRIHHATSTDGRRWQRHGIAQGLEVSPGGWDAEMTCYPYVFRHGGDLYMLYNGNGYGRTGFGIAIRE